MTFDNGTEIPLCLDIEMLFVSAAAHTNTHTVYGTLIIDNRNRTFLMNKKNTYTLFSLYFITGVCFPRWGYIDNSVDKLQYNFSILHLALKMTIKLTLFWISVDENCSTKLISVRGVPFQENLKNFRRQHYILFVGRSSTRFFFPKSRAVYDGLRIKIDWYAVIFILICNILLETFTRQNRWRFQ